MGNVLSTAPSSRPTTKALTSECEIMDNTNAACVENENESIGEQFYDTINEDEARTKAKEEEMNEFRKQLDIKREQRRVILARHRTEKEELEKSLESERTSKIELYGNNKLLRELLIKNNIDIPENLQSTKEDCELSDAIRQMKEEFDKLKTNNNILRRNLAETNNALQRAYSDIADLNSQNTESIKQINALKEVITVSKTLIKLREEQLNELKDKLNDIEQSLADRETNMLSADLRQEYERQLQNIRTLRGLYEERARLAEVTRQGLVRELEEQKNINQAEVNKNTELAVKIEELENKVEKLQETIENKNDQISSCENESRGLKAEMSVVNKLFSQVLLGYKTKQDLDKLVHRLEENHGLLTHMAERENGSEASSALPKLLLELVNQVDEEEDKKNNVEFEKDVEGNIKSNDGSKPSNETEIQHSLNTRAEEIVQNLPKVWRVLMELLSHQNVTEVDSSEKVTTCYKSVETKTGPVLVPSVSQTYIRLKDLIIEKLTLIKEVNRIKQLNTHLESRLGEQERRLCLVTSELSKTWHVVGRLRRHHHQLHTHEKILKYELQQKRKLLNELKEELEYCREKWEQAREKNSQSERDWRKLRAEFSNRKTKPNSPSFNNSAESGYSDERPSDDSSESNDESEYVTEPLVRCKKKIKKSFETVLDSSTDLNLAAEREDPASDMLDVADLPLDTQDGDDNQEASVSDICNTESLLKCEKICDETEDEMGDITNDSCVEESAGEHYCDSDYCCIGSNTSKEGIVNDNKEEFQNLEDTIIQPTTSGINSDIPEQQNKPVIDPVASGKNINQQNKRLTKKDKKLENLEKHRPVLLKKTQSTAKVSEQINNTLDHLLDQSTSRLTDVTISKTGTHTASTDSEVQNGSYGQDTLERNEPKEVSKETNNCKQNDEQIDIYTTSNANNEVEEKLESHQNQQDGTVSSTIAEIKDGNQSTNSPPEIPKIDPKAILESIKRQNERLAKKDKRLQNLENNCSEVVKSISNTLNSGDQIIARMNNLHNDRRAEGDINKSTNEETSSKEQSPVTNINDSEPSTSNEIDHEARFAARDLRLKRLEEQTKSLVNKVNNTTSKGVKIHYKLEELHNIYGSESSRAGTPSEDSEERSQKNEDDESD